MWRSGLSARRGRHQLLDQSPNASPRPREASTYADLRAGRAANSVVVELEGERDVLAQAQGAQQLVPRGQHAPGILGPEGEGEERLNQAAPRHAGPRARLAVFLWIDVARLQPHDLQVAPPLVHRLTAGQHLEVALLGNVRQKLDERQLAPIGARTQVEDRHFEPAGIVRRGLIEELDRVVARLHDPVLRDVEADRAPLGHKRLVAGTSGPFRVLGQLVDLLAPLRHGIPLHGDPVMAWSGPGRILLVYAAHSASALPTGQRPATCGRCRSAARGWARAWPRRGPGPAPGACPRGRSARRPTGAPCCSRGCSPARTLPESGRAAPPPPPRPAPRPAPAAGRAAPSPARRRPARRPSPPSARWATARAAAGCSPARTCRSSRRHTSRR